MTFRILFAALACAALGAPARAQVKPSAPEQRCAILPDSVRGPTPGQIAERRALRDDLDSIARAHGVAAPAGILYVDVDSSRQGELLFLESNLPAEAVQVATKFVEEYLSTLPPRRGYQALIRIDGDYPAMGPGKKHCPPVLANEGEWRLLMQGVLRRHPSAGKVEEPLRLRATVRLVVNREGRVAFSELEGTTGDPVVDATVPEIAAHLRFLPARLDDVPFDVRFRYTMGLIIE